MAGKTITDEQINARTDEAMSGNADMADSRKPEYIDNLIKTIRESHPDMVWLYHNGQCYNFYRILKVLYPDAEAWYNYIEGHVYTKIGNAYYDIRGVHRSIPDNSHPLSELTSSHKPQDWGKGDNRRLFRVEGLPQDPSDRVFKPNIPCDRRKFVLSSDELMEKTETSDLTDNLKLVLKEIDECKNDIGVDFNREQTDVVESLLEDVIDKLQPSTPRDIDKINLSDRAAVKSVLKDLKLILKEVESGDKETITSSSTFSLEQVEHIKLLIGTVIHKLDPTTRKLRLSGAYGKHGPNAVSVEEHCKEIPPKY